MALIYRSQLDGLRAIAIGLVIVEHFGGPLVRAAFPIGAGALGVQLFFVLSGFLITRNLLQHFERAPVREVIKGFALGRVFRLMPIYYLTLLVLSVCHVPEVYDHAFWHIAYISNYLAISGGPLLVFWSLAVEQQFYLILPCLLLYGGHRAVTVATVLIALGFLMRVVVLALPIDRWSFELSIFGKLEILGTGVLIGALAHTAHRAGRSFTAGWVWQLAALACLIFQTLAFYLYQDGLVRHLTINLTLAVPFAWCVLHADAGSPGVLAWVSSFGLIRFIGKISYCIYLTHTFFLRLIEPGGALTTFGLPFWMQALVVVLLTFIVPALSWFLVESPLLRLKQRLLDGPEAKALRATQPGTRVSLGAGLDQHQKARATAEA